MLEQIHLILDKSTGLMKKSQIICLLGALFFFFSLANRFSSVLWQFFMLQRCLETKLATAANQSNQTPKNSKTSFFWDTLNPFLPYFMVRSGMI